MIADFPPLFSYIYGMYNRYISPKTLEVVSDTHVVLPSGKVVALIHNADNTVLSLEIPMNSAKKAKKLPGKKCYATER